MSLNLASTQGASAQSGVDLLDPAILEAARAEGQVTIYTAQSQSLIEATAAAFREAVPGIEVGIIRAASSTLANRYMSEVEAGVFEADVLNSANLRIYLDNPDMWVELTTDLIPTLAEWPENEVHGIYLNSSQGPQLIGYNSQLLSEDEAPRTWLDLLDPLYQGRGMLVDPRSSNTYMNWANQMFEAYGAEYLEGIRAQNFVLVEGGSQGAQQVAAGAALLVFPPSFAHIQPLIAQGAPMGYNYPAAFSDIAAMGPQHSWGIPASSPHPNAARVFLTWLLTDAAQEVNCGANAASVKLTDSDVCPPPFANFIPADQEISSERTDELLGYLGLQ
jgi:iron(III) transport system substrate-binding protein